ncbi:IMP cyclohydrolase [Candidatus Woesearchaeota archaeon]|nr:IMP cyclohydrolase [Candidatus Woesearchaeota archaeon]
MEKLEILAQQNMETHLTDNPCRGVVLGKNDNNELIQIAWIMGRSPNSQNRVYTLDGKYGETEVPIIKTEAADPSKVKDPRLIIYNVMRGFYEDGAVGPQVVSNGDQTDTVVEAVKASGDMKSPNVFFDALKTRYCEPDAANFTPRISGYQLAGDDNAYLSVLKADPFAKEHWARTQQESGLKPDDFESRDAYFDEIDKRAGLDRNKFPTIRDCFVRALAPGFGYCITTYMPGSKELPSFHGEPVLVPVKGSLEEVMKSFWDALEEEWRVALGGRSIGIGVNYKEPINRLEKVK